MTSSKTTTRAGLWIATLATALSAAGCGYSIPFLAQPAAPAAQKTAAAHAKLAKHGHSKPSSPDPTGEAAPRVATLRDQLDGARGRATQAPAEPYWPYHAATLYLAMSAPDSALDALRGTLARDGSYAPALALFSKLEYDAGRHDDAIAVLESARMAAQRGSTDLSPELLAGLALHYDAAGRAADANEVLGAVPKSAHRAADAAAVAVALRGADDATSAARAATAERAETAVHEDPKSAANQNNAGIARLRAGDVAGARKALLEAIELDPRRAGPYYNLAILEKYYALDDEAATQWFAKYRALSSDDPDGLGAALGSAGQKDMAEGSKP